MFQVANLLKGFGPTTDAGDPPAIPTITVVDNEDGTATLTITGSSVGSVNSVYTQMVGETAWTLQGSRIGDGTVTLTLDNGRYFAYVLSDLNDQTDASNVVYFRMGVPSSDLDHSPAHIVAMLLVDLGVVTAASAEEAWPVYIDSRPDQPDNVVICYNTSGVTEGRAHSSGEVQEHFGVMIQLRSTTAEVGYPKMKQIEQAMDKEVQYSVVTIDSIQYNVIAITRKGTILSLGKEVQQSKRNLYTLNIIVSLNQLSA